MLSFFDITPDSVRFLRRRRDMFLFAGAVFLLSFTPGAPIVPYLVPAGSLLIGVRVLRKDREVFTEFICWLFLLTPFIRRVVDYRTLKPEVLVLTAPFLVLLLPFFSVFRVTSRTVNRETAPFLYAIAAVIYGAAIGCLAFHFTDSAAVLPGWLLPIFWGLYIFVERDDLPAMRAGFERAMFAGTLVAGVYGVVQYFILPKWDEAWMKTVDLVSLGSPEPMEVRVFSIMNSPQILAVFLLVGIILAYVSKSRWKYPVLAAGFASLILSSARSSWVGFVGAVLYLAFRGTFRERLRVLFVTAGCVVVLVGLTQVPNLSDVVAARLKSMVNPQNDLSTVDREETYGRVMGILSARPVGYGLGVDAGYTDAEHDSSLVNVGFNLGFPGGIVFLMDIGALSAFVIFSNGKKDRSAKLGLQACLVGLLVEMPANNVVAGQVAFVLWSLIAILYATNAVHTQGGQELGPIHPKNISAHKHSLASATMH